MKRLPRVSMADPVPDDVMLIIESPAKIADYPHILKYIGVAPHVMAEMVISDDEEAYFRARHADLCPSDARLAIGVPHCNGPGRKHGMPDNCTLTRSGECARHVAEGVPVGFYKNITHEQTERAIDAKSLCAWKCPDIYRFGGGREGAKAVLDGVVADRSASPGWLPPQIEEETTNG